MSTGGLSVFQLLFIFSIPFIDIKVQGSRPDSQLPAGLHSALVEYGKWHNQTTAMLNAQFHFLEGYVQSANWTIRSPRVPLGVSFPSVLLSYVCHSGLSDTFKAAVDLFLVALLTRRLFFITCPGAIGLQEFLHSIYFKWYHPRMSQVANTYLKAIEVAEHKGDLPLEDGGKCGRGNNQWPRYLSEVDLDVHFPAPFYLARDNHFPQIPWLLANSRYHQQLQRWGLVDKEVENAHGALQHALFQPTTALQAHLHPVLTHLTAETVVGLHFRTKGNPRYNDPSRLEGSGIRCHLKCAAALLKFLQREALRGPLDAKLDEMNHSQSAPTVQVFVAADRVSEREMTVRTLGHSVVVMQQNPTIAHVAAKYSPSAAGVISALVDFFALARCTHFIVPSSGFSICASWRAGRGYLLNPFPKPCLAQLGVWCPAAHYPQTFAARRDPAFQWGAVWRACAAPRPRLH